MSRIFPIAKIADRAILLAISVGLLAVLLTIIIGIFLSPRDLPNWAENVMVSIGTAAGMKLGDCLATLLAMSAGRKPPADPS